jgi:hypothetical protein
VAAPVILARPFGPPPHFTRLAKWQCAPGSILDHGPLLSIVGEGACRRAVGLIHARLLGRSGHSGAVRLREDATCGGWPTPAPALAFGLMCIPLGTVNAIRALALRFGWGAESRPWATYERSRDKMLENWERAVEAYLR